MDKVKAIYGDTLIECIPLACFMWEVYETIEKRHKFFGHTWYSKKTKPKKKLCSLVFIPWKHQEKELEIIPVDDILCDFNNYRNDWISVKEFISNFAGYDAFYKSQVKVEDFYGDKIIVDNNSFIASFIEGKCYYCLDVLYKNMPSLLEEEFDEEQKFDAKKEIFIFNVNYMISYDCEPEIELTDEFNNKYFLVAYKTFIDFYNEKNEYLKLNNIRDIFDHICHKIIEYGDSDEYGKNIKAKSIVIDGKLWFEG